MQITLEKWKVENYIDFYEAASDDELHNNMNEDFPKTLDECKQIVTLFANSTDTTECVRAIKADGKIIGCIAAFFKTEINFKTAELTYWISKKYRGHGIMTKVITEYTEMLFSDFKINKVFAKPFVQNVASKKVLLKSGFKPSDENEQEYIMIHKHC